MPYFYPLVAAACLLAAPLASAGQCGPGQGKVSVTAQRSAAAAPENFVATGAQLAAAVEGNYQLSNGRRMALLDLDQRVIAEFDKRERVSLAEVGPHRFASREGDVQMTYQPGERTDNIVLSYPADSKGRLKRGCS